MRLGSLLLLVVAFPVTGPADLLAQQVTAQSSITVERLVLDVHVTDSHGNVIDDLAAGDFEVRIGRMAAEVDSSDFIPFVRSSDVTPAGRSTDASVSDTAAPHGRMFVLFFQTDIARQRVTGQMQILRHIDELIDTLEPYDRVAVVQHDSHLRLRQDFTSDRPKLKKAIRETLSIGGGSAVAAVPSPSLLEHLDRRQMLDASSPERALLLIAGALSKFGGPKTLLLLGWGLGHFSRSGVTMDRLYAPARLALERARASVFVFDISNADYHSLEVGLMKVAEDTGGFYVKTHVFPTNAMNRFRRTVEGRYELFVKRPEGLPAGSHRVTVRVKGRGAVVLAPRRLLTTGG